MATVTAHKLLAAQLSTFPRASRSQETIEWIMLGKAAAAFPTSFARARPNLSRCFYTHSLSPPLSDGGGVSGALPLLLRTQNTEL